MISIKKHLFSYPSFVAFFAVFLVASLILAPMFFVGANAILMVSGVLLSIVFLWFSYRWPWVLVVLVFLGASDFFRLFSIHLLPSFAIAPGARINFLDLCVLGIIIVGGGLIYSYKVIPLYTREIAFILASVGLSLGWGIMRGYITMDIALNGLRPIAALVVYLSLTMFVYRSNGLQILIKILFATAAISLLIQGYEFFTHSRLVLPTSTPWFYDQTTYLAVGNQDIPYLWNRMPSVLYLTYFISLAQWFINREKKFLVFAIVVFIAIEITLVRSMLIYTIVGTIALVVFVFFHSQRSRPVLMVSMILACILALILVFYGATENALPISVARFATLLDLQTDTSLSYRVRATEIFYGLFIKNPLLGFGPGSIGVFEETYGIWSTDVGVVSTLAGYGLLTTLGVGILLINIFGSVNRALQRTRDSLSVAYICGLWAFFVVATISYLFTQNFFLISPWNFSTAIALAMLDTLIRNTIFVSEKIKEPVLPLSING